MKTKLRSQMILKILLILSVFVVFVSLTSLSFAAITIDKNLNFLRLGTTLDNYRDVTSPKDMFYPTEQWERDFCYRDITKDLTANNNVGIIPGGGIYDTSVTLNAYETIDTNGTQNTYEVAWYFHPVLIDTAYSINLYDYNNKNKYELIKNQVASIVDGDAGYKAIISDKNFTKAVLSYNAQTITYDIVLKEMS